MKIWNVVLATWLWWSVMFGSSLVGSSKVQDDHVYNHDYRIVKFSIEYATSKSYQKFIKDLRDALRSEQETHGIPLLRAESNLPVSHRFILVELARDTEIAVTFVLDVTNANLVGYRVGFRSFFFRDAPDAVRYLFDDRVVPSIIAHNGNYKDLEMTAGTRREDIELGMGTLSAVLWNFFTRSEYPSARAYSLIICFQLISEAARFKYVERRVYTSITDLRGFLPDAMMLELENNWVALSTAVQQSTSGVLYPPIQLNIPNRNPIIWDSITPEVISNLAFMLFVCVPPRTEFNPVIIRTVVSNDNDVCIVSEPTVRIIGLNGLCADVTRSEYHNGSPIIMWPCKSDAYENQLWTLKTDGTIRSNGWCLTTYRNPSPGKYVMVFNCEEATVGATRWKISDEGAIINHASGLVLTSNSLDSGTTLTVEVQRYTLGQGWRATNNLNPLVRSIVGFRDLCLEANGQGVLIKECASKRAEQEWALYPDGSIRPQHSKDNCITCGEKGEIVSIASCKPDLPSQRWMFTNDGTIMNLHSKLVLDVKQSDPSLQQIILWPSTGNPNQKWIPKPL